MGEEAAGASEILRFSLTLGLQGKFEGPGHLDHGTQPLSLDHLLTPFLVCVSQLVSSEQKISTARKVSPSVCFLGIFALKFSHSVLFPLSDQAVSVSLLSLCRPNFKATLKSRILAQISRGQEVKLGG